MQIDLPPAVETRLYHAAEKIGIDPMQYARKLIEDSLPEDASSGEPLTWGAKVLAELRADDALGVWQDRPESSEELAAQFRAKAECRGGS